MSKYTLVALPVLFLSATLLPSCAQPSSAPATPTQVSASENAVALPDSTAKGTTAEIKEAGNTICPITGSKVGSMEKGAHVDYQGYRVGLCCNGCKEKFLAAPEENLKKALENK